ncbi:MAG: hypothetical protein ACYCSI_06070 [Solirubrobacteraceae bacterium]
MAGFRTTPRHGGDSAPQALDIESAEISVQRKSNSSQPAGRLWRSRQGVLTVCVNDTFFRARPQAWMDRLRGEWQ